MRTLTIIKLLSLFIASVAGAMKVKNYISSKPQKSEHRLVKHINNEDEVANLKNCLKNSKVEIIARGNPKYEELNENFNIRIITNPKGFLVPQNSEDVKSIVCCCKKLNLKITTKCGGHSFEKYSYGTDKYWVIVVSNLDSVKVENGIATVGSGLTALKLAQKLIPKGYMMSTGTCLSVGISGFTLGGGYGYMARTFGLMIDRTVQMKIVTASCDELTVNSKSNSDLFWALRGAGANSFGVVTEFTYTPIPLQKVIVITKLYSIDMFPQLFHAFSSWAEEKPDHSITPSIYYNYPNPGQVVFSAIIVSNPSSNGQVLKDVKSRFPNISSSDAIEQTYNESLSSVGYDAPEAYIKAVTYFVTRKLSASQKVSFVNAAMQLCKYCFILIDMDGGKIDKRQRTAFIHRNALFSVLVVLNVPSEIGTENARRIGRESLWYLDRFLKQTESCDSGQSYQNYVNSNLTNFNERYFGRDNRRLARINLKYDSTDLFKNQQGY